MDIYINLCIVLIGNILIGCSKKETPSAPSSTTPVAVDDLSGTAKDKQVELLWTAPSDGGSPITGYEYKIGGVEDWKILETSGIVKGLTNGTSYTFIIRAVNANGHGPNSNSVSLTPIIPTPDAPTILTGTTGNKQVELLWTAPSDGGSAITDYEYKQGEGNWISFGSLKTSGIVTGLTNGTSYTFRVRAVNTNGKGAESNSTSLTPSIPPPRGTTPGAPTGLSGIISSEQVELSWTVPSDGGSAITDYEYKQDEGDWISFVSLETSGIVKGLTNGTSYTFIIRAVNANGYGPNSNSVSLTPRSPPPPPPPSSPTPDAPTRLGGSADVLNTQQLRISLFWTPPYDGGSVITDYQCNYDGDWISFGNIIYNDSRASSVLIVPRKKYNSIIVRAVNKNGFGNESNSITLGYS